jgi:hypothetical protein
MRTTGAPCKAFTWRPAVKQQSWPAPELTRCQWQACRLIIWTCFWHTKYAHNWRTVQGLGSIDTSACCLAGVDALARVAHRCLGSVSFEMGLLGSWWG